MKKRINKKVTNKSKRKTIKDRKLYHQKEEKENKIKIEKIQY